LGIGDWGLGIGPNPQSPIPNPQSPIPNFIFGKEKKNYIIYNYLINKLINFLKMEKHFKKKINKFKHLKDVIKCWKILDLFILIKNKTRSYGFF